jgi:hypothetical protein
MTSQKKKGHRQRHSLSAQRARSLHRDATTEGERALDELERLFESLRSGAANVAGVTFQIATTAWILAAGRDGSIAGLDVQSVAPEGFEDIDCELQSGLTLLIQTKERGIEARAIAAAEVAEIIVHAVPALRNDARFAIVTNGKFGSSLPATGFTATLDESLSSLHDEGRTRTMLVDALQHELDEKGLTDTAPESLLSRTHLVMTEADISQQTLASLEHGIGLRPAVASLVRAELLRDLGEVAVEQREATLATMSRRTLTDLDLVATRIMQDVDVSTLEEAVAAGVCEPADYVSPPSVDLAGFFAGVDVVPSHIAAGFDVVRPEETAAVLNGLNDRRDVVIAGPSGSGKSTLLWRSARLIDFGVRILRVHRVADADDVELLVRHVRRQKSNTGMRLLVVADDLGRDRMAAWPDARRRIGEIPGVLTLGAVRREDLTPEISASAVVIDPILTQSAATRLFDALETSGVATVMAREEAVAQANGLLMEFIALATTGRRLRDVLAVQVNELGTPENRLRREALRLVCAAHLLGSPVPAHALPQALSVDPDAAGDAMSRLAGEHLVVAEGRLWHGLHDLRTEVLFDLLHSTPPPTMSMTYARALAVLPVAARGPGARRAAVRIGRAVADTTPGLDPSQRLYSILEALHPIADTLRDQLNHVAANGGDDAAAYAASLIEAADRLDTTAYVHAVLPFVERNRPAAIDLATLAGLVYSNRVDHVYLQIEPIVRLGRQLPERRSTCAAIVTSGLTPSLLFDLTKGATIRTAVRLLEAAEGLATLTPMSAREIYNRHVAPLPNPPGSEGTRLYGDLRAQLTASLAVLAHVRGPDVASTFGAVEARAADAVACDDYGCSIGLSLVPTEAPGETVQNLARPFTYSDHEMLVARAVGFALWTGAGLIPSAYAAQPGSDPDSLNEQAVLLARRVFDACPEVDHVNVEIWSANCRTTSLTHDDVKSLRAGVLRRRPAIARNVAFQASVAEALSAEHWTRRLREQARIAQAFIQLLEELPARLRPHDNAGRRRDWVRRAHETAQDVANMPGRPAERRPVLGTARKEALRQPAADIDEELRAKDLARVTFDRLSGALQQVADNLDDSRMVRLAGSRFADVPSLMREARTAGVPVFGGVGETLPEELDGLAAFVGRLLTALGTKAIDRALRYVGNDRDRLEEALIDAARSASRDDADIVARFLKEHGVAADPAVIINENPMPAWRNYQAVVTVDLEMWGKGVEMLQNWEPEKRVEAGLTGRVIAVATDRGEIVLMGLGFFGTSGDVIPLGNGFESIARELGVACRRSEVRSAIQIRSEELTAYSYELVRHAKRDPSWSAVPPTSVHPQETAGALRDEFREALEHFDGRGEPGEGEGHTATAAGLLLQLCDAVASESGEDGGLAAQLASIDITNLNLPMPEASVQLYGAAHVAALEADRSSRH